MRKELVAPRKEVQDDSNVSLSSAEFRIRFQNAEALYAILERAAPWCLVRWEAFNTH